MILKPSAYAFGLLPSHTTPSISLELRMSLFGIATFAAAARRPSCTNVLMLHHSKIRAMKHCDDSICSNFFVKRPINRGWEHNGAQVDMLKKCELCPSPAELTGKAVQTPCPLSQFGDGVVTMLQQRRNSGVLPTHELF